MEACAQDRSGGVPTATSSSGGGLGGRNSGVAPLLVGGLATTPRAEAEDEKSRWRDRVPLKDVKNEGRSGNVYENKGPDDNLPDTKDAISAWLRAILHKKTRIFQKLSPFLPLN